MAGIKQRLDRWLYPSYSDHWDDWAFRDAILARVQPSDTILDMGAGAGIVEAMRMGGRGGRKAARVCGIDPDERVLENPFLDEAKVAWGESIPYGDETFDLVYSCNVLEHLREPAAVLREVRRVLRPGGMFLGKTPNRYHYVPLIAAATPHWFHQWYNQLRGRESEDTFPTHYRANSRGRIRSLARQTGFEVDTISLIEGRPEYLRMNPALYLAGFLYERAVNQIPLLDRFRCVLIAELRKPLAEEAVQNGGGRVAA